MSTHLIPCGGCGRHVMSSDPSCPFCGAAVDASTPVPGRPARRLNRAATFAFGAAVAAASATGCGESHEPGSDAGMTEADAGVDAGAIAPPYGIPPEDGGGPAPLYGAPPPEDAGTASVDAGFFPLYGGAPDE